jgi:hypothetical protein
LTIVTVAQGAEEYRDGSGPDAETIRDGTALAGRTSRWTSIMHFSLSARVRTTLCLPALLFFAACAASLPQAANGIEMFTYFGDGSRIGLPSLEVPVEAYPGIPLRSDRLRARRRAMQAGPGSAVRLGPPGVPTKPGGIIIRAMPQQPMAVPVPAPVQQP